MQVSPIHSVRLDCSHLMTSCFGFSIRRQAAGTGVMAYTSHDTQLHKAHGTRDKPSPLRETGERRTRGSTVTPARGCSLLLPDIGIIHHAAVTGVTSCEVAARAWSGRARGVSIFHPTPSACMPRVIFSQTSIARVIRVIRPILPHQRPQAWSQRSRHHKRRAHGMMIDRYQSQMDARRRPHQGHHSARHESRP